MRKLFVIIVALLAITTYVVHAQAMQVDEYYGYQWEKMMLTEKHDIVGGVLAGIQMVKDFALDLDPYIYEHYKVYSAFLMKHNVVPKIIETLDRYYELNRDNYKYKDRVTVMIMAIYGKYWWQNSIHPAEKK